MTDATVAHGAAFDETGRVVMERVGIPKDRWEIAAQLEVLGFRDGDARERFGCTDLFEVAQRIYDRFQDGHLSFVVEQDDAEPRYLGLLTFLRRYVDGLMTSLPMVLQGCTMLLWGYGLWGATDMDVRAGSAIALGFIGSYLATSGFAWAIVSRGLFYRYQKEGALARWSALRMWSIAVRIAIALAVPALLANALYQLLPVSFALTAALYYVALAVLWLNWSLVYLVGKTHWLLATLLLAIVVVYVAATEFGWPVIAANMAGLVIADTLTFLIALIALNRNARQGVGKATVNPPRVTVLIYSTAPMFLYGLLYSAFVFTDRVMAWTSMRGREDFPPYPFWLNARYELAMDLALVVVVLLAGVVEYSAHHFTTRVVPQEKRVKSGNVEPFLEKFRAFYRRHSLLFVLFAAASVAAAFVVATALRDYPNPQLQESLASTTTVRVFWIASVSYAIFMFALRNILILLSLSRADLAIRVMAIALGANVLVGFVMSRAIHYSGAALGLLAGSIVLAVLAHRQLRTVLRDLDYYYYAAY